jgi:hypothetical protein
MRHFDQIFSVSFTGTVKTMYLSFSCVESNFDLQHDSDMLRMELTVRTSIAKAEVVKPLPSRSVCLLP